MSQRIAKVESLVRQVVAEELLHLADSARYTVTAVDVSPDMRQADVWIGIIAADKPAEVRLFEAAAEERARVQAALAARMTTKFVPKIHLKHDTGGEYAERISKLIDSI